VPRESVRRKYGGTLTFFFCDLRDYTAFVEAHGDAVATKLIAAYRALVRSAVARAGGGEIRTEGDSFYVIFSTAAQALQCAIEVLNTAVQHTADHPELPIRVGIGIHAGEPVAHEGEFVGSAGNVASRLASQAGPGELLVSEVVRGLLRTSGLAPMNERTGVTLKGISDAPRVFAVAWQDVPYMANAPADGSTTAARLRAALTGRWLVAVVVAVFILVGGAAFAATVGRTSGLSGSQPSPAGSRPVDAALPPHGPLLFEASLNALGAQRLQVVAGDPVQDQVRFLGDAIELQVSAGSWLSLSVVNLAPDDFVVDYAVVPVSGQGSYALWFRGAQGRQLQVQVAPQTGELTVQVARSFQASGVSERLFGPTSRIPPTRDTERRLAVAARGRDLSVYFNGGEVAKASDPDPHGGGVGFVANAAQDRPLVVRLTALRIYGPQP